jgi:iron complex outermembrane receptor protein
LSIHGLLTAEQGKTATSDGSVALPAMWQLDLGAQWTGTLRGQRVQLRLNAENLTDRTYWREAPTQPWGGIYLFPSTPRTVRASVGMEF